MTLNIPSINGSKTYLSVVLYGLYLVAIHHGWMEPNMDIETFLKAAIAMAFAHKVSKIGDPTVPAEKK